MLSRRWTVAILAILSLILGVAGGLFLVIRFDTVFPAIVVLAFWGLTMPMIVRYLRAQ